MTDPSQPRPDSLAAAVSLARHALGSAPAGVLTDLDGTLAPIVDDPDAARPLPDAVAALTSLAGRLAVVAVISGRAPDDARRRLGTDRLLVIGNHGLERLEPGAERAALSPALAGVAESIRAVLARVPAGEGISIDDKGPSATIHYRNAPDPEASARRIAAALGDVARDGLSLRAGRMSWELRAAGAGNKGSALAEVVSRHGLRGLLVLGDDVTDLDMFRAAAEARARGELAAAILAVAGGAEVPPSVAAAADAVLPDPRAVASLLAELAERA
ncbi:MAG TPA: trehalose-phosphatase [Candidatus Limnocylindria bacterium]|jgi:trehalose 6-phosphate phosphatase